MTSLSMKSHPALLCGGIFVFFFLVTRGEVTTISDNIIHTTADDQPTTALHHSETQEMTHLHTDKPLAELSPSTPSHKTPPATGMGFHSVTTAASTGLLHSSRNQTTTANEEPPGHSQSGTEKLTSDSPTTESHLKVTLTEVKSTEVESTLASKSPRMLQKNGTTLAPTTSQLPPLTTKSTIIDTSTVTNRSTLLLKITTTREGLTESPATKTATPTMIDTTTATVVTNRSTLLPNITTTREGLTESPATKTAMPTTSGKNITDGPFIQTTATTELPSMANPTNGTTLVPNIQTTSSVQTTPPLSTTTDHVTSQSTPRTSIFTSDKATTITDTSTTGFSTILTSNGTEAILIPIIPKKLTTSKPNNTKVTETPLSTTTPQPCSSIGVVKQCLIIIASLSAIATIFIISTIVLCTKLSSRKYRVKKHQTGTEMMCISSLLPERNHHYSRQRSPVPNGVLVIPTFGDSDDEIGDNLTLSSFLPENDRYV